MLASSLQCSAQTGVSQSCWSDCSLFLLEQKQTRWRSHVVQFCVVLPISWTTEPDLHTFISAVKSPALVLSFVLTLTVCWRNLFILLLIVSSTSDLQRRPVPGLTSAGSYLQHLCCDNAMNGSSHPTKTPKAGRTYCTLLFLLFLSFFHLSSSASCSLSSGAPWQHRR